MKRFQKSISLLLAAALVFCLSACGGQGQKQNQIDAAEKQRKEEIIRNNLSIDYLSEYSELPAEQNRIGISVTGGGDWNDDRCVKVAFGNSHVYQSFSDSTQLISRCHLYDAEHPEVQIETKFFAVDNGDSDDASFGGVLTYKKGLPCEYLLLKFDGVRAAENANWETPAIFWIIALETDGTVTVLTDTPLLDK